MARGGMRLNITADTRGLNKGLSQAQSSVDRFARGAGRLSRLGGGGIAGVVGGLTSLGGAAAFVKESVNATNDLYLASKRLSTLTGMDVQTSSQWVSLAKARGVQSDVLARSYTTLAKQLGAAQRGSKSAADTFRQLGVSQDMLKRGNTSQIMGQLADGFAKHADGLGKARVASQLFGRNYAGMLKILNGGKGNLTALLAEEAKHGPMLDANTRKYQQAREAQLKLNQSMERLKVTVGSAVLPYITKLANVMDKWLSKASNRQQINQMVSAFAGIAKQGALVAKALVPIVSGIAKFAGKHPQIARIVADLIAVKMAAKLIGFGAPMKSLSKFAGMMGKLVPFAQKVGGKVALAIASGLEAYAPRIANSLLNIGASIEGKSGNAAAKGGLLGLLLGGAKKLGKFAVSNTGKLLGGAGAFLTSFNSYATDGTGKEAQMERNVKAYQRANYRVNGKFYGSLSAWLAARDRASRANPTAGMTSSLSNYDLSLPSFSAEGAALSQNNAAAKKKAKPTVTPEQAMRRAAKLRHWAHPFDVRLSKISVNDHTLAADRRRKSILEQGVAKWRSVRGELKKLAGDASRGGDAEISGRIWDIIHRGDQKAAAWKAKLAIVTDAVKIQSSQDAIDNANRKLAIAQSDLKAEDAFLRAAFGFGDIGVGAANGYLAAGGAATAGNSVAGGNVNIVINSLHPGDASTKMAIGKAVTASFVNQGGRKRARTKIGA